MPIFTKLDQFWYGKAFISLPMSLLLVPSTQSFAQDAKIFLTLPELTVTEARVANSEPAGSFATTVTGLRYEPLIDLQSRNIAEAQGDVTVRGGIFENTGFRVGAATLFDPQTGHYFPEIPIDPAMLSAPGVITGIENAHAGFNSTVGTVNYAWDTIGKGGEAGIGLGDNSFNLQRIYVGELIEYLDREKTVGLDFSFARSESDGTRPNGDHDFNRYAGRVQIRGERSQTDFVAGYQSKFFGWPNMYTPFNVNESENLQSTLYLINHRQNSAEGSIFEFTGYYRRHRDDYEFNRFVPGQFNPFQHETFVWSAGFEGRQSLRDLAFNYSGQFVADEITSSNLVFGPFRSRSYYKFSIVPEWRRVYEKGTELIVRAGASFDDSNRDGSKVSPMASLALSRNDGNGSGQRLYFEVAESSQVPGYTVIGANPNAGLFRGKPDAARERSRNIEVGAEFGRPRWRSHVAIFYRIDRDLLDWTFSFDRTSARSANPVDIDTFGGEFIFLTSWEDLNLILGYTFLSKNEDYGSAEVDASFYALNYPRHRFTAALTYRFLDQFELRMDNEFRSQEENPLRHSADNAAISSLGLNWISPQIEGLGLGLTVDNLFDSDFEEIPATPAVRRQVSSFLTYRW